MDKQNSKNVKQQTHEELVVPSDDGQHETVECNIQLNQLNLEKILFEDEMFKQQIQQQINEPPSDGVTDLDDHKNDRQDQSDF